jgi:hypothetical protein
MGRQRANHGLPLASCFIYLFYDENARLNLFPIPVSIPEILRPSLGGFLARLIERLQAKLSQMAMGKTTSLPKLLNSRSLETFCRGGAKKNWLPAAPPPCLPFLTLGGISGWRKRRSAAEALGPRGGGRPAWELEAWWRQPTDVGTRGDRPAAGARRARQRRTAGTGAQGERRRADRRQERRADAADAGARGRAEAAGPCVSPRLGGRPAPVEAVRRFQVRCEEEEVDMEGIEWEGKKIEGK